MNRWLEAVLIALPLAVFVGVIQTLTITKQINFLTYNIPMEVTIGVLSSYGIILGFWSAIIGLSKKEHKLLWMVQKKINMIEVFFIISLSFLVTSVFLLSFQALALMPSMLSLLVTVIGFYFTCLLLGLTVHIALAEEKRA